MKQFWDFCMVHLNRVIGDLPELKALASIVTAAATALYPVEGLRIGIGVGLSLMAFDWVTGIMASRVNGEKLSSKRAERGLMKAIIYALFPAALYAGVRVAGTEDLARVSASMVITYVVIQELISISENIKRGDFFRLPKFIDDMLRDKAEQIDNGPQKAPEGD